MGGYRYEIDGLTIESSIPMTDTELRVLVNDVRAMRASGASSRPVSGSEADGIRERFGVHGLRPASRLS